MNDEGFDLTYGDAAPPERLTPAQRRVKSLVEELAAANRSRRRQIRKEIGALTGQEWREPGRTDLGKRGMIRRALLENAQKTGVTAPLRGGLFR
jgi:hypothetical protein